MALYNFIFYKCGRSTELQKSANETLYASSQISPTIFLEAKETLMVQYWCKILVQCDGPISNFQWLILFGITLLLKGSRMKNASISSTPSISGCCFSSFSEIYKRQKSYLCSSISFIKSIFFCFLSQYSDLPLYLHCGIDIRSILKTLSNI